MFEVEIEWEIVRVKELEKERSAPGRRTVRSMAYRYSVELGLPHKLISAEELARYHY
jgi:hypothetical protein